MYVFAALRQGIRAVNVIQAHFYNVLQSIP